MSFNKQWLIASCMPSYPIFELVQYVRLVNSHYHTRFRPSKDSFSLELVCLMCPHDYVPICFCLLRLCMPAYFFHFMCLMSICRGRLRAHVPFYFLCLHPTCLFVLRACLPSWFCLLRAHVPMYLFILGTYFRMLLYVLCALCLYILYVFYMPTYPCPLRAYIPLCLCVLRVYLHLAFTCLFVCMPFLTCRCV